MLGINGKQDEFNAAMGLANFKHLDEIIAARRHVCEQYDTFLKGRFRRPQMRDGMEYNHAYYPIVFESENELIAAFERLAETGVYPRRYFYPSLNTLPYLKEAPACPVSEDIASRIACLPLYVGLEDDKIREICAELI